MSDKGYRHGRGIILKELFNQSKIHHFTSESSFYKGSKFEWRLFSKIHLYLMGGDRTETVVMLRSLVRVRVGARHGRRRGIGCRAQRLRNGGCGGRRKLLWRSKRRAVHAAASIVLCHVARVERMRIACVRGVLIELWMMTVVVIAAPTAAATSRFPVSTAVVGFGWRESGVGIRRRSRRQSE